MTTDYFAASDCSTAEVKIISLVFISLVILADAVLDVDDFIA